MEERASDWILWTPPCDERNFRERVAQWLISPRTYQFKQVYGTCQTLNLAKFDGFYVILLENFFQLKNSVTFNRMFNATCHYTQN